MKGTYIKVINDVVFDELKKLKKYKDRAFQKDLSTSRTFKSFFSISSFFEIFFKYILYFKHELSIIKQIECSLMRKGKSYGRIECLQLHQCFK